MEHLFFVVFFLQLNYFQEINDTSSYPQDTVKIYLIKQVYMF